MRRSDFPLCAVYLGHVQRDAKEQKRREDGEKTYLNALPFTNVFFLYGIQRPLGLSLFFLCRNKLRSIVYFYDFRFYSE